MRHLLYRALEAEHGVVIKTPKRALLRGRLYKIMRKDIEFENLSLIFPSFPEDELWIMKVESPDGEE